MKVLVIGGGGREHAIVQALARSPRVSELLCAPGNGGIAGEARCCPVKATDIEGIVRLATEEKVDFCVVAPDDPLHLGCVDALEKAGIRAFGPNAAAARIESSKAFAKELMHKYSIPTAEYRVFTDSDEALEYVRTCPIPIVLKADGLALGKGVIIARTRGEALDAVRQLMQEQKFGSAGSTIVIEEYLTGREVTWLLFADGESVLPMPPSQDHKRAFDGDQGLNTGGMGAFAPTPYFTEGLQRQAMETVILPMLRAMVRESCPFRGVLYAGLMLTEEGPKVIEFNARFGDPETQAVLPLLESDLLELLLATTDGTLTEQRPVWKDGFATCVVLASGGYPESYPVGFAISGIDAAKEAGALVFHAGTALKDGQLVTSGGRVLGVTALGETLEDSVDNAYRAAGTISFEGLHMRTDIGRA